MDVVASLVVVAATVFAGAAVVAELVSSVTAVAGTVFP